MVQWIKSNFKVYTEVYFDTFLHYLPLSDDFKTSNLRAWHTVKRRSGLSVSATPNILATDLKDWNRMWLWVTWYTRHVCNQDMKTNFHPRGGESYFPYILLNEIQTMFSQLAKRSARVLPADLCTDHAHYVKNHRSTVLRNNILGDPGAVSRVDKMFVVKVY